MYCKLKLNSATEALAYAILRLEVVFRALPKAIQKPKITSIQIHISVSHAHRLSKSPKRGRWNQIPTNMLG